VQPGQLEGTTKKRSSNRPWLVSMCGSTWDDAQSEAGRLDALFAMVPLEGASSESVALEGERFEDKVTLELAYCESLRAVIVDYAKI
jgi:hypothetical protein